MRRTRLQSATTTQGDSVAATSNGIVAVNLGTLANGATATISVRVNVTAASGTVLTDTATVTAATQDLNSANNSATQKTTVSKK